MKALVLTPKFGSAGKLRLWGRHCYTDSVWAMEAPSFFRHETLHYIVYCYVRRNLYSLARAVASHQGGARRKKSHCVGEEN